MLKIIDKLIRAMYPQNYTCEICGGEIFYRDHLCEDCEQTVNFNNKYTCDVCGRQTTSAGICIECKASLPKFNRAVSAIVYEDGAVTLIHKFKQSGAYLKDYFADLVAPLCAKFEGADALCYIPMTNKSLLKRGYNQAELLAEAIGERIKLPAIKNALTKKKQTDEQKTLNRSEREKNLAGCFKADRNLVKDKVLILVDDVMTTGATADEASSALLHAGAKAVYFAAVASVTSTYYKK